MGKNTNEVFKKIIENYSYMEKMIGSELKISSEHGGITGSYREKIWIDLFRRIIPQKYTLEQGVMIIDSLGNISKEVDIVVYDEQYTPYIFQYNTLKFIPIEAVVIVIECKSTGQRKENLENWVDSIDMLMPKKSGIARIVSGYACGITNVTQERTRPIKILATMNNTYKKKLGNRFDFIIINKIDKNNGSKTGKKSEKLDVFIKNEEKALGWWARTLNNPEKIHLEPLELQILQDLDKKNENKKDEDKKKEKEELKEQYEEKYPELKFNNDLCLINTLEDLKVIGNPLLSLNLQLNQLLMLLNNPMLFPHYAYAATFNKIINQEKARKIEEGK